VLSCRTTYLTHVIPESVNEEQLATIVHCGFGGAGGEAANVYLAKRGIVRPGSPNLVPEFLNPLFLKTCCDYLDREGRNELPRGLRGVSAIFGFYNEAVVRAVTRRMGLDPHLELVSTALSRFADLLVGRGEGYAPKADVISALEAVVPSGGRLDRSLLSQLESEGVLAIEPVRRDDGSVAAMVRFTFERYSDHAIAAQLLREHLDPARIEQCFAAETPLGDLVFGVRNYRFAGIIEAIAIQLPEKAGAEILDVRSTDDWTVHQAFLESLLWREQSYFTDRTWELVKGLRDEEGVLDLLVAVATEPSNRYNAAYLHELLLPRPMPERDESWSVYLNGRGAGDDPVGILISWALQNGMGMIEDERARLSALALSWLLTSANRAVRDRATKALACLFATRLRLAAETLRAFATADDLYVRERLFAAVYGAALQGKSSDGLYELTAATYDLVFATGSPPPNELLRDHARGIVAYAEYRELLPTGIDLTLVRPPYSSEWPIEYVSDELIESYQQNYDGQSFRDAIVGSTVKDGDFARYVIDHTIDKWAPVPLGAEECPSAHELAWKWIDGFVKTGSAKELAAFQGLLDAARALGGDRGYQETPERAALRAAEAAFKGALPSDLWEEYRVTAMNFVQYSMFDEDRYDHGARFNQGWARRWICRRAHDLGWTPDRFAILERNTSYDGTTIVSNGSAKNISGWRYTS